MDLEDHAGDILRKARMMSGVSPAAAARAAGISESSLGELESSGKVPGEANLEALAALVGLDPKKLDAIAWGWRPAEKDLSLWRELRWFNTAGAGMSVNAYLVWDEVSRQAAVFDTGWDAAPVLAIIAKEGLELRHLFLTHTHADHVAGLGAFRAKFPKLRIHTNSRQAPVDQRNRPNDCLQLGSLRIMNRDTPGHSEDGVTYIVGNWPEDAPAAAFVGDALFAGSIGRGNQSWELARQKVREQILTLPADTLLCPGHGPVSTVAEEQAHNPFF